MKISGLPHPSASGPGGFYLRRTQAPGCGRLHRTPAASRHRLPTLAPDTGGIPPPTADSCTSHRRHPATGRGQLHQPPAESRDRPRTIASTAGGIPPPSADNCFGHRRHPATECGNSLRPPAESRHRCGHLLRLPAASRHRVRRLASAAGGFPPPPRTFVPTTGGIPPSTVGVCFDRLRNPATDCGRLLRPPAESRRPRGQLPRPPAASRRRQGQIKKPPGRVLHDADQRFHVLVELGDGPLAEKPHGGVLPVVREARVDEMAEARQLGLEAVGQHRGRGDAGRRRNPARSVLFFTHPRDAPRVR